MSLSAADITGVTVDLTLNSCAALNFPVALNASSMVTGAASAAANTPASATMTGA